MTAIEWRNKDSAAAQILSMAAGRYAGRYAGAMVKVTTSEPPSELSALEALIHARQILGAAIHLPAPVASALRNLQVAAIFFTVQLTASDNDCDLESLQRIKGKLIAKLEQDTAHLHSHDCTLATQRLGDCALNYMHQIIRDEDNHVPIRSHAVARALTELHLAAVMFTTQLATAESYDPTPLQRIKDKLVAVLT